MLNNPVPLFVQQVGSHFNRQLRDNLGSALLARVLANQPEQGQGKGFHIADMTGTVTAWANLVSGFTQGRTQTLAGHLQQAKTRNTTNLHPGAVGFDCIAQAVFHLALVFRRTHIDKVDNDQTADIPNP